MWLAARLEPSGCEMRTVLESVKEGAEAAGGAGGERGWGAW